MSNLDGVGVDTQKHDSATAHHRTICEEAASFKRLIFAQIAFVSNPKTYMLRNTYVLVLNGFSAYKLTEVISLLVREQFKNLYVIILVPVLSFLGIFL